MLGASQTPESDPLLGRILGGKYTVIRKLGEGGMGTVYEGQQQLGTTTRRVAIKTLHPHVSRDPKIQARFMREVATIAQLEHPNTIQVYDFGSTDEGILYLVMEFLHGQSLADILAAQGPLAPDRAKTILSQVCGSLEEAHARSIVHRDLKPENILLVERAGQRDFVKVLDFGIAKRSKEEDTAEQKLTQQGMVVGTPPYMSPEQFKAVPIDGRSDIYSLGVVAYEMTTGRLPFHAQSAFEWATQHMTQPPIPMESFPEGARVPFQMREAIHKALAKSPDDRFQTMREFGDAFASSGQPSGGEADRVQAATSSHAGAITRVERLSGPLGAQAASAPSPGVVVGAPAQEAPRPHTPASGNVSFPSSGGFHPRPETTGPNRKRGALLMLAALVAVVSVAAIVFAVRGGPGNSDNEVVIDNGATPVPETSLVPTALPGADTTPSQGSRNVDVPPLSGGGPKLPHPAHPSGTSSFAHPDHGGPALSEHSDAGQSPPPRTTSTPSASHAVLPPPPASGGSAASTPGADHTPVEEPAGSSAGRSPPKHKP